MDPRMSPNAGRDDNAGLGIPDAGQGNNVGPQGGGETPPGHGGTAGQQRAPDK